jgi:hypothetical protein
MLVGNPGRRRGRGGGRPHTWPAPGRRQRTEPPGRARVLRRLRRRNGPRAAGAPGERCALLAGVAAVVSCAWPRTARAVSDLYWLGLLVGACGVDLRNPRRYQPNPPGTGIAAAGEPRPILQFSYSVYLLHASLVLLAWVFVVEALDLPPGVALATMVGGVWPVIVAGQLLVPRRRRAPVPRAPVVGRAAHRSSRRQPAHLARPQPTRANPGAARH